MATLTPEQLNVLWYLLAGFVLGFAFSTLWEWLYFRRIRLEHGQEEQQVEMRTRAWSAPDSVAHNERPAAHYQSQGVLLENEQSTDQLFVADLPFVTPVAPVTTPPVVVEAPMPAQAVITPVIAAVVPTQPVPPLPTNPVANDDSTLASIRENI